MRLWHYKLIPHLPRQQLLGLHREICGMRGKGWGKKHSTVDYVWKYPYLMLFNYHMYVIDEMFKRGYSIGAGWFNPFYRGQELGIEKSEFTKCEGCNHYPEHNNAYLQECLDNLKSKGIKIEIHK